MSAGDKQLPWDPHPLWRTTTRCPAGHVALTLRQAETEASAMKRQDVRLSPTWAAPVRFPGHGLVRAKSRQEPLPAAKRLIPLPPRAPGASPRLPGPQRPPSAWSPRVSAPTRRPCPHHHQVTQLRGRPSAPRSVCSRGTRPEAGGSDGSPLLPTPAPRSTRSVSTGGRCEPGNLQASVCLGSLRGGLTPLVPRDPGGVVFSLRPEQDGEEWTPHLLSHFHFRWWLRN